MLKKYIILIYIGVILNFITKNNNVVSVPEPFLSQNKDSFEEKKYTYGDNLQLWASTINTPQTQSQENEDINKEIKNTIIKTNNFPSTLHEKFPHNIQLTNKENKEDEQNKQNKDKKNIVSNKLLGNNEQNNYIPKSIQKPQNCVKNQSNKFPRSYPEFFDIYFGPIDELMDETDYSSDDLEDQLYYGYRGIEHDIDETDFNIESISGYSDSMNKMKYENTQIDNNKGKKTTNTMEKNKKNRDKKRSEKRRTKENYKYKKENQNIENHIPESKYKQERIEILDDNGKELKSHKNIKEEKGGIEKTDTTNIAEIKIRKEERETKDEKEKNLQQLVKDVQLIKVEEVINDKKVVKVGEKTKDDKKEDKEGTDDEKATGDEEATDDQENKVESEEDKEESEKNKEETEEDKEESEKNKEETEEDKEESEKNKEETEEDKEESEKNKEETEED
ncbi:hypothetical protein PRSY57_0201500, partial [Plasmodium reichenowi]